MRPCLIFLLLALPACQPGGEGANQTAPAEPAAVGPAQSGAEGQVIADEQAKAVEAGSGTAAQAANGQ